MSIRRDRDMNMDMNMRTGALTSSSNSQHEPHDARGKGRVMHLLYMAQTVCTVTFGFQLNFKLMVRC